MSQQCSDCYNGCTEILSDQCIRYTGIDNNTLGIKTGDSLSYVEQALVSFLSSTLDGTGIKPDIPEELICELVSQYLDDCDDITEVDLFKALIQAACNLQEQIDTINAALAALNADYDVDCLDGVTDSSDTHDVVQAIIVKLCALDVSLTALALDVSTNYVKLADLNALIQAYLDSIAVTNKAYAKMVPYVAQEYYGPTSNYPETGDSFDVNGVGSGYWENVYLCNGYNGLTPDKRGRVAVCAISGMGGGVLDPEVDPGVDPTFNPNYALNDTDGENSVSLIDDNIPVHVHPITDVTHTHLAVEYGDFGNNNITATTPIARQSDTTGGDNDKYRLQGGTGTADVGLTTASYTGITTTGNNVTTSSAHNNKQPVIAALYIMYIPA